MEKCKKEGDFSPLLLNMLFYGGGGGNKKAEKKILDFFQI